MSAEQRAAGIVLCGGQSSRMGRPKAWLPFGPRLLLQHVVDVLREVVHPVVVVAGPDPDVPALPGDVALVRDEREFLGPLNGLATGLAFLEGRADVAYLSSCDVPFLTPQFVRTVIAGLGDADVCLPEAGGRRHPLAAVYRTRVLPVARRLIDAGELRLTALADRVPATALWEEDLRAVDPELQSLRNINSPGDYEAALRDAGYAPSA